MAIPIRSKQYFTPLFDEVSQQHGIREAIVYGMIWRYCQMRDGVCRASLNKIAERTSLSRRTVIRSLAHLVEAGLIQDQTENLVNRPHVYRLSPHGTQPRRSGEPEEAASEAGSAWVDAAAEDEPLEEPPADAPEGDPPQCQVGTPRGDFLTPPHANLALCGANLTPLGVSGWHLSHTRRKNKKAEEERNPHHLRLWNQICQVLRLDYSKEFMRTQIEPLVPLSWDGRILALRALDADHQAYLRSRCQTVINRHLFALTNCPEAQVEFQVGAIDAQPYN